MPRSLSLIIFRFLFCFFFFHHDQHQPVSFLAKEKIRFLSDCKHDTFSKRFFFNFPLFIIIQYIKDFPTELKRSDLGDLRVLLINSEW